MKTFSVVRDESESQCEGVACSIIMELVILQWWFTMQKEICNLKIGTFIHYISAEIPVPFRKFKHPLNDDFQKVWLLNIIEQNSLVIHDELVVAFSSR